MGFIGQVRSSEISIVSVRNGILLVKCSVCASATRFQQHDLAPHGKNRWEECAGCITNLTSGWYPRLHLRSVQCPVLGSGGSLAVCSSHRAQHPARGRHCVVREPFTQAVRNLKRHKVGPSLSSWNREKNSFVCLPSVC